MGKTQGSGSTTTTATGDKEAEAIKIMGEWAAILEVPARAMGGLYDAGRVGTA